MSAAAEANTGGAGWDDPATLRRVASISEQTSESLRRAGKRNVAQSVARYAADLRRRATRIERRGR